MPESYEKRSIPSSGALYQILTKILALLTDILISSNALIRADGVLTSQSDGIRGIQIRYQAHRTDPTLVVANKRNHRPFAGRACAME